MRRECDTIRFCCFPHFSLHSGDTRQKTAPARDLHETAGDNAGRQREEPHAEERDEGREDFPHARVLSAHRMRKNARMREIQLQATDNLPILLYLETTVDLDRRM